MLHAACDACCTGMLTHVTICFQTAAQPSLLTGCLFCFVFSFSNSQNISQLEIFGDMSTPPDITSPSVSISRAKKCFPLNKTEFCTEQPRFFFVTFQPDIQCPQTPASPANTLDPSQGLQPPTELFAPFNPASVPSGEAFVDSPPLQAPGEQTH